jgi:hypothetical protein
MPRSSAGDEWNRHVPGDVWGRMAVNIRVSHDGSSDASLAGALLMQGWFPARSRRRSPDLSRCHPTLGEEAPSGERWVDALAALAATDLILDG